MVQEWSLKHYTRLIQHPTYSCILKDNINYYFTLTKYANALSYEIYRIQI